MAGRDPAIYAATVLRQMAGSSPAMTVRALVQANQESKSAPVSITQIARIKAQIKAQNRQK